MKKLIASVALAASVAGVAQAQTQLDLNVKKLGAPIQSTMYGLFFEDINYAADGGLYAEMVKNRSFEFPQALQGWESFGNVEVLTEGAPFERNPHYVRLSPAGHAHKHTGIQNEGFFGVTVLNDSVYRFSMWARVPGGEGNGEIRVELVDPASMGEKQNVGVAKINVEGKDWKKYTATIKSHASVAKGKLRLFLRSKYAIDVEHVSLFPKNTFKGRENGLRQDLAQALKDIHPGVLRFPGGCIVEGTDLESRYQWKNSVGAVENRPLNENRWHYTFAHRFFPDYYQSYGLGFFEFFQLSEDIGAEPLPVVSVGLSCQFQNKDAHAHVAIENLQPYIDDALDLIEFANGDVNTKWGKLRAEMGHPAPFNLKFIGIGNEQWGPEYPEHLKPFVEQVRAKYPNIKIVGSSGPDSEGEQFDYLWPEMKKLKADLVDEHFYRPESWFLAQGNRYDNYDRKGPKVFAGEYACHGKGKKWNHYEASMLEAAFMTGIERNADIVHMATYAPLFAHVEGWQWRPDMIWYDNTRSFKTVSYYVQQLYAMNKGTNAMSLLTSGKVGKPLAGNEDQNGLFASAVYDATTATYIVKIVNTGDVEQKVNVNMKGINLKKQGINSVELTQLQCSEMDAENSLDEPNKIVPTVKAIENAQKDVLAITIAPKTVQMYKFKL